MHARLQPHFAHRPARDPSQQPVISGVQGNGSARTIAGMHRVDPHRQYIDR